MGALRRKRSCGESRYHRSIVKLHMKSDPAGILFATVVISCRPGRGT